MVKTRNGDIIGTPGPGPVLRRVLRLRELELITGLRRSSIYDMIAQGQFPKQMKLGVKSVGWLADEVAEWQQQRIAERDRQSPKAA